MDFFESIYTIFQQQEEQVKKMQEEIKRLNNVINEHKKEDSDLNSK